MKVKFLTILSVAFLFSCGGYTEDQANAAEDFCNCMEADTYGDFDINFFECDLEVIGKYKPETFADEGWSLALEETCPGVAGQISE